VVYEYYVGQNPLLQKYETLLAETDRLDAAQLDMEDVLDPKDYILLGYTLDPRTGLGAYREYFLKLVGALQSKPIAAVLQLGEVKQRVETLKQQDAEFREATRTRSRLDGNVVLTDFRDVDKIPAGNRFLVYTLFPQANVSVRVHRGPNADRVACAVGHSIFNRTCRTAVGQLMSDYGGGGHAGAGTCLLPAAEADRKLAEIVERLKRNG
jgi:hypothetical protein